MAQRTFLKEMKKMIRLWTTNFKNNNKIYYDLKGFLKDTNIWIAAYMKISKNKGAMTKGST